MKKKTLLIVMSSFVTVATAATVILSTQYSGENPAEAGSYTITLDGGCASNCHFDSDSGFYRFELNGKTEVGKYDFSSIAASTYFAEYSGADNYVFGGDNILTVGSYFNYNFIYIDFIFDGPGVVTEAYASVKTNVSDYYRVDLDFNGERYNFCEFAPNGGSLILNKIVFKYTC